MSGVLILATQERLGAAPSGGGGGSVSITNQIVTKVGNGTITATASISYGASGAVTTHTGAGLETWLLSGVNSDYEIRATTQAGSVPTGTFGSWMALSTTRTWSLAVPGGFDDYATFLIEIRDAAVPNTVRDSATITLEVTNVGA